MICSKYQNADIITVAHCSVNTVKAVRHDMDSCKGDEEAVLSRKRHSWHVVQNSFSCRRRWWKIQVRDSRLSCHHEGGPEWRSLLPLMREVQGTNSDSQDQRESLDIGKKALEQSEVSCWTGDDLVLLIWKELLPGPVAQYPEPQKTCLQPIWYSTYHKNQDPKNCDNLWVCLPHIFEHGLRFNSDRYVKLLERVAAGRLYVWQQDMAPCHASRISPERLLENFYNFTRTNFWPPNFLNCNPMYVRHWLRKTLTSLPAKPRLSWWSRSRRYSKIFSWTQ